MVDVSTPIDGRTAWNLVRAVPPGLTGQDSSVRVHDDHRSDVWLQVHRSGRWEASTPVTDDARDVLALYLPLQVQADLVVAQIGQSLDGRIATESGHSQYVTGPADIRRLHRLRALVMPSSWGRARSRPTTPVSPSATSRATIPFAWSSTRMAGWTQISASSPMVPREP